MVEYLAYNEKVSGSSPLLFKKNAAFIYNFNIFNFFYVTCFDFSLQYFYKNINF